MVDPLIQRMRENKRFLEWLERVWGILYFEGSGPDIGIRRENFIKEAIREELKLNIEERPSLERQIDFYIKFDDERSYSLKTMETVGTLKVAWNSYPDIERLKIAAGSFQFKTPILFVYGEGICVFDVDDIERVRRELGFENFWWIPRRETNPRGFGVRSSAVERLIEIAKRKGNHIKISTIRIEDEELKREYFRQWFKFMKSFAEYLSRKLRKPSLREFM